MRFLRGKIGEHSIIRNSFTLIGGTAIAQLIPIFSQVVLRRYYSPEQFGEFSVYASMMGMFAVVSCGKLETALVVPKSDSEANQLFFTAIVFNVFYSCLCFVLICIFNDVISEFLHLRTSSTVLYLVPLGIFLFSLSRTLNFWLIRQSGFKQIAVNKIIRRSSEAVFQLGFISNSKTFFLIGGALLGDLFNNWVSIYQSVKKGLLLNLHSLDTVKLMIGKYKHFITLSSIPSWLNSVSLLLPVIIVNTSFSTNVTGNFDLSRQVLAIPLALVSMSLSQLSLNKFSALINEERDVFRFFLQVLGVLVFLGVLGSIVFYFFSDFIFSFFGDSWSVASDISKILVWSYLIKFIVSPLTSYYTASQKLKLFASWQVLYFAAIFSLFFVDSVDLMQFIMRLVLIDVIFYTLNLGALFFLIKKRNKYD